MSFLGWVDVAPTGPSLCSFPILCLSFRTLISTLVLGLSLHVTLISLVHHMLWNPLYLNSLPCMLELSFMCYSFIHYVVSQRMLNQFQ